VGEHRHVPYIIHHYVVRDIEAKAAAILPPVVGI